MTKSALSDLFDSEVLDDSLEGFKPSTRTTSSRHEKRRGMRVHREENLRKVFPEKVEAGTAYHFLSSGDIDQLSYPTVLIEKMGLFDCFYCSTWTMTHLDVQIIEGWAERGLIQSPTFAVGEYFQKRETAAYATLAAMLQRTGGRLRCFPNHAKLVLMGSAARDEWMVLTGSSNLSMNPRCEQTILWNDREIFEFYRGWFESLFDGAKP
jgi:hypothetical protein